MSATVSARQAATLCNVSGTTVLRWIASGRLPATQVDGAYQIAVADLEAFQRRRLAQGATHTEPAVEPVAPPVVQHVAPSVAPSTDDPGLVEMVRLIRDLNQQVMELSGRLGWMSKELELERERSRDLERQVKLLSAPSSHSSKIDDPAPSGNGLQMADPAPTSTAHLS